MSFHYTTVVFLFFLHFYSSTSIMYQNPVLDMDFPDPTVIRGHDGMFYAYATMGNGHRLQVSSSSNLVNWTYHGEALGKISWLGQNSWAPDVSYHNNQYYLYFGGTGPNGSMCIGVTISQNPLGPFEDPLNKPLYCDADFHAIDPKSFDDPVTGKIYLYWGSDFIPLQVQELAINRTAFAPGTSPLSVIYPNTSNPYESLVEGSWVYYYNTTNTYYIMYSGDNCCGSTAHYAVMVAQATNPLGPFTKLGNIRGNGDSTILYINPKNNFIMAPGHNSVVTDDNNTDWIFYHAYVGSGRTARKLMMDKISYVAMTKDKDNNREENNYNLWPNIGYPSNSVLPGPVIQN